MAQILESHICSCPRCPKVVTERYADMCDPCYYDHGCTTELSKCGVTA